MGSSVENRSHVDSVFNRMYPPQRVASVSQDQEPDNNNSGDSRLLATAWHEAGHALVAVIVGRPIQKVTVAPAKLQTGGVRLGAVRFQKGRSKSTNDWLEDEVLILLAGMVAESKFTGQYCQASASHDLRAARNLMDKRAATERQMEKLERRLLDKVEHLLEQSHHVAALKMIVDELMEKQTIKGRTVKHFLNMATQQR